MAASLTKIFFAIFLALLLINIIPYNNNQVRDYANMQVVLTWVPTFCASQPIDGCNTPMLIDFSLHGLWPSNRYGDIITCPHPTDEELKFLYELFEDLGQDLENAWPSVTHRRTVGLWYHEYKNHGYCVESKLNARQYFKGAIKWRERINLKRSFENQQIFPSDHISYSKSLVLYAVHEEIDIKNKHHVILSCVEINGTHSKLNEVFICLDPTLTTPDSCPPRRFMLDQCSGNKRIVLPHTIN